VKARVLFRFRGDASVATTNYVEKARAAAREVGFDPDIFVAQVNQESGFNPDVPDHWAGDPPQLIIGICQFAAGTAAGLGINPRDPDEAIPAAAAYMGRLLDKYGGDYSLALAAYNAGSGAVDKYHGVPPYSETQAYVKLILGAAGKPVAAATVTAPQTNIDAGMGVPSQSSTPPTTSRYANAFTPSNYAIVAGSAAYGDVLFGRRYRVIVSDLSGNNALDVSDLHCRFSIVKSALPPFPMTSVTIFNLNAETENAIINESYRIVVEGGYVGSRYGLLTDANIIQVIRSKEDGTSYRLDLIAMDSDVFANYGVAAFTLLRGQNKRAVIERVASTASVPTQLGNISPNLSDTQYPRGRVVFGLGRDILRQLAQSESAHYYQEDGRVNIVRADDLPTDEIIDLTPSTGLIGTPSQQDYGVNIQMLLEPRLKIGTMVHVDNSLVRNQQYETEQVPYSLDKDGLYKIAKFTHSGDSRGVPWYSEVVGISQAGKLPSMISSGLQNPF
jgi:hypothetical protein